MSPKEMDVFYLDDPFEFEMGGTFSGVRSFLDFRVCVTLRGCENIEVCFVEP